MTIYISGGITGVKNYQEHFAKAEEFWISAGHDVVNPAKMDAVFPSTFTYEDIMDIDLDLLAKCDAVYLLKGWEKSRGANMEAGFARANDLIILKETDELREG